jgi:hypothetical protein
LGKSVRHSHGDRHAGFAPGVFEALIIRLRPSGQVEPAGSETTVATGNGISISARLERRPVGAARKLPGRPIELVPSVNEQAALTRAKILRQQETSLREIAKVWKEEFGLASMDTKSVQRNIRTD